jgi:hypothetical protein
VFVEADVNIDQYVYREMLQDHLIPWAKEHFGEEYWCFQQDSAPAHKAYDTQIFLGQFQDFIFRDKWPANSPDLNPLDYFVWSILEAKACAKPHKDIESLKRALIQAWDEITPKILAKIVDNFPKILEQCIKAKGGHFE